jgi:hypothetical protein
MPHPVYDSRVPHSQTLLKGHYLQRAPDQINAAHTKIPHSTANTIYLITTIAIMRGLMATPSLRQCFPFW